MTGQTGAPLTTARAPSPWDRARPSVIAPVVLIVAIAIICIVVAVMSAGRRADEAALDRERQLFSRAVAQYTARTLREVESVAELPDVILRVGAPADHAWIHSRIGLWLRNFFAHETVLVFDAADRLVYAMVDGDSVAPDRLAADAPNHRLVLDELRGRRARAATPDGTAAQPHPPRTTRVQLFLGRPSIVAAVSVTPSVADGTAPTALGPVVATVQSLDGEFITNLRREFGLTAARQIGPAAAVGDDHAEPLADSDGATIARFAWTPSRLGPTVVANVVPFIAVALGSFAVLVGFVLRFMRRSAATIADSEHQLRRLAMHDPLSDLPNRTMFAEALETTIRRVRRTRAPAALLAIDLDHFKEVNDTLGHHVGDVLIRAVAQRLNTITRTGDLVARLGGDEFAVILTGADDPVLVEAAATRVIAHISEPYAIGQHTIVIGASVGIAVIDGGTDLAADIMRYADMALYRAKSEGRNRAWFYDEAMESDLSQRKQLERELREAIDHGGLSIAYQPLVSPDGERVVGVEALCRWNHPTRGAVPPAEFIPVAEQSGLIIPLGDWVLRRACLDARDWTGVILAVNVSALQFRRPDFVPAVGRALDETGFDARRLELEITESVLIGNVEAAELEMRQLKELGVRLALDDFGTGYSSLLYLRTFPFDKLKIDRSFIRSIESGAEGVAVVHAIVGLGRGLGMQVTAEGVETAEQHLFLRAAGVHSMQGYRFGKPVDAATISTRIATQAAAPGVVKAPRRALAG